MKTQDNLITSIMIMKSNGNSYQINCEESENQLKFEKKTKNS